MKLYLAAVYTTNCEFGSSHYRRLNEHELSVRHGIRYHLESYHYIQKETFVKNLRRDGVRVFLYSGAFSAYTKGVEIDLPGYCRYIKDNSDIILEEDGVVVASVLDGIGDPLKTYQNQMAMEALGVRPLPCFHYGEDERYLEHYIENYGYITLGGMVPVSTKDLYLWLDRIWGNYLTDSAGHAKLKVHGFGLTAVPLMERYPWHSIDSSSWVQLSRHGTVLVPGFGSVSISDKSPGRKNFGQHAEHLPPAQRARLVKEFADRGFTWESLAENYWSRDIFNIAAFKELNDQMNNTSLTYVQDQQLFF